MGQRVLTVLIVLSAVVLFSLMPHAAFALIPGRHVRPEGSRSMNVHFPGAGGFTLRGTLTVPAADQPSPALLLLPGSGPTDRDGNQPPALVTDLLKQLAETLAKEGIATLRFDKRASHVYVADWPKDVAGLNRFFSWQNFTDDAKLAYLYLRSRPGVDAKRSGILGHSEGGIIALAVASALAAKDRPAALVLAGTPGRPLSEVVHNQVADLLSRQKATPDQVTFFLDKNDSITREVIRTGVVPADVPPGLAALFPPSAALYLQAVLPLDPRDLARQVTGPVFVMNGEKDIQVLPEKDTLPLAAALRARKGSAPVGLEIIPGASHNLKPIAADPNGFTGPVAPAALERLSAWLKANLSGSP